MTFEVDLKNTLGPLVGGRAYPVVFPQPTSAPIWPAIRFVIIDSVPVADICGDGDDNSDEVRVQLDVVSAYTLGYVAHRALRQQVRVAMRGFPVPARIELSNEQFDIETQTYRSTIDYSLHGST